MPFEFEIATGPLVLRLVLPRTFQWTVCISDFLMDSVHLSTGSEFSHSEFQILKFRIITPVCQPFSADDSEIQIWILFSEY